MAWNLHITGKAVEADIKEALDAFIVALNELGHEVLSAVLTTDEGISNVPVGTTPAEEPTPAPTAPPPTYTGGSTPAA
jgi:hypothetical protein